MELCELAIARGLHDRSWRIVTVYEESGDLSRDWDAIATLRRTTAVYEPSTADRTIELFDGVDVLYVHETESLSHARRVAAALDVPLVSHLHLPPYHVRHGIGRILRGHHMAGADPLVFTKATKVDKFLSVSRHNAEVWIRSGIPRERISVVPNGIDTERFRPARAGEKAALRRELGLAPDAVTFVFVGRVDRVKGLEHLLAAYESAQRRTDQSMALVVVGEPSIGDGAEGEAYQRRLQQRSPGVSWLGKRRDVDRVMRAADVAVVPSRWDEPFGLVAVEAMASGLPVIATRRGGLPEILTGDLERGLVRSSVRSLTNRMVEFAVDSPRREALGAAARRIAVARYDQSQMADEADRHLRSLVGERSCR
jgi:glycosyltransferase involved in cell wall biosynthesis